MSSINVVQNAVMTLSKQRVRLHFEKYDCPLYGVQFINDTKLPLKIVSSEAGSNKDSFSFDKDLSAFLKQSVLFFSVLHLRIHNPSQWQRVTFRLTTRSHVRLIKIAVSNLWFGVNKMLSYISLSLPRSQYKFSSLSVIHCL